MEVVNKKIVLVLILIGIFSCIFMWQNISDNKTKLEMVSLNNEMTSSNMFAIMLEQDDGTYEESRDNSWPSSDVYLYDDTRSGCMDVNGNKIENTLTYDTENNIARVKTEKTSYCYLYFSIKPVAFAIYSEDDNSLRFYNNGDTEGMGNTYNGLAVTEIYINFLNGASPWRNSEYKTSITTVVVEEEIQPTNTSNWFNGMKNLDSINLEKLNTSNVTNMFRMFLDAGINSEKFEIVGLNNWNTSSVSNISQMFWTTGLNATEWNIGDISNWDVSKVTTMGQMFYYSGSNADEFRLDLSKWNTSNVLDMSSMFNEAGVNSNVFDIGNISNWDTSKVTNMTSMFNGAGQKASYKLDLSSWDVSNVISYDKFNNSVESKVIAPAWVN